MKHVTIISVFLIVVTACAGHHDDSTSITDDPYDNILYIPDTTVKSDCLVLLNPGNNDLDLHGRAGILKALQARLRLHKIAIPIRIIFGEEQMSGLRKRLIKINRLDSLTMILSERSSMDIKSKLKTHRPVTVLIDSVRRMVITGDICSPSFKQRIYDYYLGSEKAALKLEDSVLRVSQNPDTFIYLKNNAVKPLIIYEIESSCDCSKVKTDSNIIPPLDSVKLYLSHIGTNKTKTLTNILIFSNDMDGIREIKVDSSGKK